MHPLDSPLQDGLQSGKPVNIEVKLEREDEVTDSPFHHFPQYTFSLLHHNGPFRQFTIAPFTR